MDMNVAGALSAYTYQSTLAQTGSASQALTQALATSQSQVGQASALLAGAGSLDGAAALAGGSGAQALASLAYSASAASGNGPEALQAMLATLGGGTSGQSSTTDSLPLSTAILSPSTTEALVRYAYDQSQNPKNAEQLAITAGQQALLTSGLNLTA